MPGFAYRDGELTCEGVSLTRLAQDFGTPLYVYGADAVRQNYRRLARAFAPLRPLICYAVKANFNLALLRLLNDAGAGFDIVSGGELHRVLRVGADPARVVFAGVGKTDAELGAALDAHIGWFNVESADELARLNALAAERGRRATVALRLNPDVVPDTHRHIATGGSRSKFGLPASEALALVRAAHVYAAVAMRGVHVHIGSQIPDPAQTLRAIEAALDFMEQASALMDCLDFGGGFPVAYQEADQFPDIEDFAAPIVARLSPLAERLSFHVEPGRYLVANAGALVATVQAVKEVAGGRTLVVDAGLNDLLRPALYGAQHRVLPLVSSAGGSWAPSDVVGPICETADVLARGRDLPPLLRGDQLAFMDAGAYGFSMSSQYNARPRAAEVLVEGGRARLVRRRETFDDMVALEL